MRQIGTEAHVGGRAGDGVAVDARRLFEDAPPVGYRLSDLCRPALICDPAVEGGTRVDVHTQEHLRVLRSAVLRALAEVQPRFGRLDPSAVDPVGYEIGLAGQTWNPEAVIGVGR